MKWAFILVGLCVLANTALAQDNKHTHCTESADCVISCSSLQALQLN